MTKGMDVYLLALAEASLNRESSFEHLGAEYVAAYLRQHGYTVTLQNVHGERDFPAVAERILRDQPILIGIGATDLGETLMAQHLVNYLCNQGASTHICIGGHTPTLLHEQLLAETPALSSVVRGEGEETALELVDRLKSQDSLEGLPGLAFNKNGHPMINPPRSPIKDLDALPFPARDLLDEILAVQPVDSIPLVSSRGCHHNCAFCSIRSFYRDSPGPPWRGRSPKNIVDEIEELIHRYEIRRFNFLDDTFIGPGRRGKMRAIEFANEILERRLSIEFSCATRADQVDADLVRTLQRAGLIHVCLGVESGVQRVLDTFNKRVTVEQNRQAILTLKELELSCDEIGFIAFDPYTTLTELRQNLEFVKELGLYRYPNIRFMRNQLIIVPGTPIEERLLAEGRLPKPNSLADYESNLVGYGFDDPRTSYVHQICSVLGRQLESRLQPCMEFLAHYDHWLNELSRQTGESLQSIVVQLPSKLRETRNRLHRWTQSVGAMALVLFERVLGAAEGGRVSTQADAEQLSKELEAWLMEREIQLAGGPVEEKIRELLGDMEGGKFSIQHEGREYSVAG